MKKISYILTLILVAGTLSCSKEDFADAYQDPSKLLETNLGKQYSGFLYSSHNYYVPSYWHYFSVLRTTLNYYNQAAGSDFGTDRYLPAPTGTSSVWDNYYASLLQYRTFETVYNNLSDVERNGQEMYLMTAKIYLYDYTQRMVDLFGPIPFDKAGRISQNGGDFIASLASYDTPEYIYTTMLDDLKAIAGDLSKFTIKKELEGSFKSQDYINAGDLKAWQRYANSLRLRMLTRVSEATGFSERASKEMAEILGDPATYPVVDANSQNILIDVTDIKSPILPDRIGQAFGGGTTWFLQTTGKKMMDFMSENEDPRLLTLFHPGDSAKGKYYGIDPVAPSNVTTTLIDKRMLANYNPSTFELNQFFPGVLVNSTEVELIKAEYYLKNNDEAKAKAAYEKAVGESIDFYYNVQSRSANKNFATKAAPTDRDKAGYLAKEGISWQGNDDKLKLIAMQRWVHFNLVQPYENWADNRRLDKLNLQFEKDKASTQTLPPVRWNIPSSERTYNSANYTAISADDNLNKRLFWDVK